MSDERVRWDFMAEGAEARYSRLVEAVRRFFAVSDASEDPEWEPDEFFAAAAALRALVADSDFFGTRPVVDVKDERL